MNFTTSIETVFTNGTSLEDDLEDFSCSFSEIEIFYIPNDILAKGKEMMKVYLYLYAIENYIRLFIQQVCLRIYGQDYFVKLALTKNIKDTITGRKRSGEKMAG
jgi:hypothetical protein